jgi:LysM repeat protein
MKRIHLLAVALLIVLSGCSMFHKTTSSSINHKPDEIAASKTFLTHKVEKGENLNFLSKKYKVSKEEIITMNKELNADPKAKIEEGKMIKIPVFQK